jgi:hypothetical protein
VAKKISGAFVAKKISPSSPNLPPYHIIHFNKHANQIMVKKGNLVPNRAVFMMNRYVFGDYRRRNKNKNPAQIVNRFVLLRKNLCALCVLGGKKYCAFCGLF